MRRLGSLLLVVIVDACCAADAHACPAPRTIAGYPDLDGPQDYHFVGSPIAGDFDGDGLLDVAVTDGLLFARPHAPTRFVAASSIYAMPLSDAYGAAAADVNGDGFADLVTTEWNYVDPDSDSDLQLPGTIRVSLGFGDGTFAPAIEHAVGLGPIVALGDIDGDGRIDVIVAHADEPTVRVLLGNGDGSLRDGPVVDIGAPTSGITLADLDGDGRLDIATSAVVLFNDRAEGLVQEAPYSGDGPIVTADFDGDGWPDLAVGRGDQVDVLMNTHDGGFTMSTYSAHPRRPPFAGVMRVDDVDGDGRADLAIESTAAGSAQAGLLVRLNRGDGTFGEPAVYGPYSNPLFFDVDGDGDLDLVADEQAMLNRGDGTFITRRVQIPVVAGPSRLADVDGDCTLDLVQLDAYAHTIYVTTNVVSGVSKTTSFAVSASATGLRIGDMNEDGFPDLVLVGAVGGGPSNSIAVWLNDGHGGYGCEFEIPCEDAPSDALIGDVDNDGHADAIVSGFEGPQWFRGHGDGSLSPPRKLPFDGAVSALADLDHDGVLDLLVAARRGLGVFQMRERGAFEAVWYDMFPVWSIATGDFDGDGALDVAVATWPGPSADAKQYCDVSVLRNRGDGSLLAPTLIANGPIAAIAAADFNRDGTIDLGGVNFWGGALRIFANRGDGTFANGLDYAGTRYASTIDVGHVGDQWGISMSGVLSITSLLPADDELCPADRPDASPSCEPKAAPAIVHCPINQASDAGGVAVADASAPPSGDAATEVGRDASDGPRDDAGAIGASRDASSTTTSADRDASASTQPADTTRPQADPASVENGCASGAGDPGGAPLEWIAAWGAFSFFVWRRRRRAEKIRAR